MKKRCFLHIGTPKTGTTSLQKFLSENRARLADLGYLYPFRTPCHANLAWILTNHPSKNEIENTWDDLEKEINTRKLDNIILSSEFFITDTIKDRFIATVAQKLSNYDTKIIIYIKQQHKYLESSLGQILKTGFYAGEISDYYEGCQEKNQKQYARHTNYLDIIERWGRYFDYKNVIVVPLEVEQTPDIYDNFVNIIGIDGKHSLIKPEDLNSKPNLAQMTALYIMNQQLAKRIAIDYDRRKIFSQKYLNPFLKETKHWESKNKYYLIPYEFAMNFLAHHATANAIIAKKYLNREDGQLFYEPLQKYEHDTLEISNLDENQILDMISFLVNRTSPKY